MVDQRAGIGSLEQTQNVELTNKDEDIELA